jgi:hypothetical protein
VTDCFITAQTRKGTSHTGLDGPGGAGTRVADAEAFSVREGRTHPLSKVATEEPITASQDLAFWALLMYSAASAQKGPGPQAEGGRVLRLTQTFVE